MLTSEFLSVGPDKDAQTEIAEGESLFTLFHEGPGRNCVESFINNLHMPGICLHLFCILHYRLEV